MLVAGRLAGSRGFVRGADAGPSLPAAALSSLVLVGSFSVLGCLGLGFLGLQPQQVVLDPLPPQIADLGVVAGEDRGVRLDDHVLVDREVVLFGQQLVDQFHAFVDPLEKPLEDEWPYLNVTLLGPIVQVVLVLVEFVDVGLSEIDLERVERLDDSSSASARTFRRPAGGGSDDPTRAFVVTALVICRSIGWGGVRSAEAFRADQTALPASASINQRPRATTANQGDIRAAH